MKTHLMEMAIDRQKAKFNCNKNKKRNSTKRDHNPIKRAADATSSSTGATEASTANGDWDRTEKRKSTKQEHNPKQSAKNAMNASTGFNKACRQNIGHENSPDGDGRRQAKSKIILQQNLGTQFHKTQSQPHKWRCRRKKHVHRSHRDNHNKW